MTRKRKRNAVAQATTFPDATGAVAGLEVVHNLDIPAFNLVASVQDASKCRNVQSLKREVHSQETSNEQGWEMAASQRPSKKRKSANYPEINRSPNSRLQSSIKIGDLQALVLYILCDGPGPHWVSIRHHSEIRKVVVLMAPGLEKKMFTQGLLSDTEPGQGRHDGQVEIAQSVGDGMDSEQVLPKENEDHAIISGGIDSTQIDRDEWTTETHLPVELSEDLLPEPLKPLAGIFPHLWPVLTPGDDKYSRIHSPVHAMLTSSLPKAKEDGNAKGVRAPREAKDWKDTPSRITDFITSVDQLKENGFALHPAHLVSEEQKLSEQQRRQTSYQPTLGEWVDTRVGSLQEAEVPENELEQGSLTVGREVLAMDCEMCKTSDGELALTRISILNWGGDVVLDELVKPSLPIVDYLTAYSGITQLMLEPVQTTLADIQTRLLSLLHPKTILIGHSLNADLGAIRITHPFIVDTSILYPHPRGSPLKSSLKWLAKRYLSRDIQAGHGSTGHSSIEDARACLDLVKLKCEKGPLWGTNYASSESIFKRLERSAKPAKHMNGATTVSGRVGAIVDWGRPEKGPGALAQLHIGCQNDEEVIEGIRVAVLGSEDDARVPGGGVDFVWARLRALEYLRGWRMTDTFPKPEDAPADTKPDDMAPSQNDPGAKRTSEAVTTLVNHISKIFANLPPCTAFIVYSGSGDPREMIKMQTLRQRFQREYQTKKWDLLSVKWTDVEDQRLRASTRKARQGLAMVTIK